MKKLCALACFAILVFSAGCSSPNSTGGSGGSGEYYAPAPSTSVDNAVKLQQGIGSMVRSGIR